MPPSSAIKERAKRLQRGLAKLYPDAHCALNHENALQLLIATILSAQCTDVRVNMVTPSLFSRYPNARAFAQADPSELEQAIKSTGFYRNKTKSIIACCKAIIEKHGGLVPNTMENLVPLPGVGRKTANVILGNAFGVPGIVVDTHVGRLARRMGLTKHDDPEKVEQDLMAVIPKKDCPLPFVAICGSLRNRHASSVNKIRGTTCSVEKIEPSAIVATGFAFQ